ncbi:hypothetical protein CMUS01_04045 [Colletotrichum musicola]|uniref:Uncharacterized protein n=1 Tax=Colletotrichum musicola TaxID=2175873 RepID=A0A8H6NPH7_9PEZI|nr:hypothetical protein CMUS01_04045 [Colletotrichum musicola]
MRKVRTDGVRGSVGLRPECRPFQQAVPPVLVPSSHVFLPLFHFYEFPARGGSIVSSKPAHEFRTNKVFDSSATTLPFLFLSHLEQQQQQQQQQPVIGS